MQSVLQPLDILIFFGSLLLVMGLGLWAGRKEDTSEDYYLAGRSTRWWGVAGSIFGSNVSANHIVGMMGIGFSVGFAQSHYEIGAIVGLLLLCYGFLPVYRKLNIYTLSEYLGRRYDDSSRVLYAIIMILIMVVVQMVPGYYIGSRSLNVLLFDYGETATATVEVGPAGMLTNLQLGHVGSGYTSAPKVVFSPPVNPDIINQQALADTVATGRAVISEGKVTSIELGFPGANYTQEHPPAVSIEGGASFNAAYSPGDVNPFWYMVGIIVMAVVTGSYTIFGGLKAVIFTDVVQSVLMIFAALVVAILTFSQPEVGGWTGMLALDAAENGGREAMRLYLPTNHATLPWTGVLSGVMILHVYYWGTNQFIVQRALSARSDSEAKLGIIVAGFFKLLIPFMSIGTGIAAYYYFGKRNLDVDQDAAFTEIMRNVVAPVGFGLVGLVAAGLIGAILSSLDSMMNSAATIITFDIYKRYVNPEAEEKQLIRMGRLWITLFISVAAVMAIFTMDPNSKKSFFFLIAEYQNYLVSGIVVAFVLGMFWKRATAAGGCAAIVTGILFSFAIKWSYNEWLSPAFPWLQPYLGTKIAFAHTAFFAAMLATLVHVVVSLLTPANEARSKYVWTELGGHSPLALARVAEAITVTLFLFAGLATAMVYGYLAAELCAVVAAVWTFSMFLLSIFLSARDTTEESSPRPPLLLNDRFWAGLLAGAAIFIMFFFWRPLQ